MPERTVSARPREGNLASLMVVLSFLLATALMGWSTYQRYRDFLAYHHGIAAGAVAELAHAIEGRLAERRRLVQVFAEDHAALIRAVAQAPEDSALHASLDREVRRFFPDFFAFTLTTVDGTPLLQDFEGYVGDLCLEDVRHYAGTGTYSTRVHPNAFVYHYDIMSRWGRDEGILLISFPASEIASLLRASQATGHELIVRMPDAQNLIEITAAGARDAVPKDDYRMPAETLARTLVERPIEHSRWVLSDGFSAEFRMDYRSGLLLQMAVVTLLFGAFSLIIGVMLRRHAAAQRQADRLKDEFLAVVSHELRTPLTSIQGALALLDGGVCGSLDAQGGMLLDIARKNTDRLRLLVDDLLDIGKIEAGKLQLHVTRQEIMDLVCKSLELHQGYALRSDVNFVLGEKVDGVPVDVDALRFSQVMGNLLANAAKFSPAGAEVEVGVRQLEPGWVEVAVRDHGPGIDPRDHTGLFKKFFQADGSDSRRANGTGLGLAIVKALVEAQGGQVGFVSLPGQGSTFYFRLPVPAV